MFSKKPEQSSPPPPAAEPVANGGSTFSVIGEDVTITGDVEASADLHVDGTIRGDMMCASLVQGESSRIEGAIRADTARLSGEVEGIIEARELIVLKTARIEGDVSYDSIMIEQGAAVHGRFAPRTTTQDKPQGPRDDERQEDQGDEENSARSEVSRISLAG